ncbi:unnamed protein product, partial [Allacma fusca]
TPILIRPLAYSTDFGDIPAQRVNQDLVVYLSKQIEFDIEKFWHIEEIPLPKALMEQEQICENHYKINTVRLDNGKYHVRWPTVELKLFDQLLRFREREVALVGDIKKM